MDKTKSSTRPLRIVASAFLGLLLACGAVVATYAAEITEANVAQHVASAKTPADQQALAAYFRSQAAAQGERIKLHEDMLASYKKAAAGRTYRNMERHCESLIDAARKQQKQYEALAAEYDALAKGEKPKQ